MEELWQIAEDRMRIDPVFVQLLQSARDSGLHVKKTFLCAINVLKADKNMMTSSTDLEEVRRMIYDVTDTPGHRAHSLTDPMHSRHTYHFCRCLKASVWHFVRFH